jgi:hypothetical protein
MPKRVYQGPHLDGCVVHIPGESDPIRFPDRKTAVDVTADQAAALDTTGEFTEPAKPKAKPAADKSEED